MPKLTKQYRCKARQKLEKEGKPIPPDLETKKVGRKRSSESQESKLETRRKKYHHQKMRKLELSRVISTFKDTSTMTLRRRKSNGNNLLLNKACDILNTWSTMLRESCDSVRNLRKAMSDVRSGVEKHFKWISTVKKPILLAFVSCVCGETVYHPWVEVKKSEIIEEGRNEKCYGLYAARDFLANTEIGIYTGNVETIHKGIKSSEFKLSYRDKYLIDIEDQSEKRLKYQMGAHMVNDKDWEENTTFGKTNNNAMITDHLILTSTCDIKEGEEITVSYNLDK